MPKASLIDKNTLEAHGRRVTFTLVSTPIGWQGWTDENLPIVTCTLRPTRAAALRELRTVAFTDIGKMVARGLLAKEDVS